jgi:hypothetical protein
VDVYLRLLAAAEPGSPIHDAARRKGRGLCLPHLAAGLRLAIGPAGGRRLIEIYRRRESELREELSEFIRKHDYLARDEQMTPAERASWLRAVATLVGEGPPQKAPGR